MISTSRCILKNRKLLDAISFKVQNVSSLHLCKNHQSLNNRKLLSLCGSHKYSGLVLKPVYAARFISTKDAATQVTSIETESDVPVVTSESVNNVSSVGDLSTTSPAVETVADSVVNTSTILESASHVAGSVVNTSAILESASQGVNKELLDFPIPDPPKVPDVIFVDPLVDPPFEQLGLGGLTPVGWVQNAFEFLHVNLGLPWWECIVIGTICVRSCLFPVMVLSQRNSAVLQNNQLELQEIQLKINESRQRGESMEAARHTQDLMLFMKKKGINPLKNAIIPLLQAPVFLSFFMGLREMANVPLKSMHVGGLFWFTDLTVPDQFYILPIITSLTMFITIEVGADSGKMTNQNHYLIKYILRGIPIVMLPFTINFPAAILVYWTSTNLISLTQVALFQVPKVRDFLRIERKIQHNQDKLPIKPKGFVTAAKEWWNDTRTESAHADRSRKNVMSFNAAGRGAVPKTYKYNPTLSRSTTSSASSIQAKK